MQHGPTGNMDVLKSDKSKKKTKNISYFVNVTENVAKLNNQYSPIVRKAPSKTFTMVV